jgi:hypothetical protein
MLDHGDCYTKHRPVDISGILPLLADVKFEDTHGPNGWIARPEWMAEFIADLKPEGKVTFTLMRKLPAYQNLPPHIDSWGNVPNVGRRLHVPLVTHPDIKMRWPDDGVEVHMEAGWLWEVNYLKLHEVQHLAPVDRIHLHYNVV